MSILKNRKVLFYLVVYTLLIFLSGLLIGKCLSNDGRRQHWGKHRTYSHHMMTERFTKSLSLTPLQVTQLEVILDKHKESIMEIRQDIRKSFKVHREKKIAEIDAILTPEQKIKFKEMREKHKRKRHRRHRW